MAVVKKVPWLFYALVVLSLLSLFGIWFFKHPNSPWHSRNNYYIAFEEIGNLRINNAVNINGVNKGYVAGFELTDSCVWVEIAVLAEVKISINSKFYIANAGLMGERIVEISLGESTAYYKDKERIKGYFDMGSTTIGNFVVDIAKEAKYISDAFAMLADTLFSDERKEDYGRIEKKAKQIGKNVSRVVGSAELSLEISLDSLTIAKNKVVEILDSIDGNMNVIAENFDLFKKNLASLEKLLIDVKNSMTSIAKILEDGENTISQALDKNQYGRLRREMQKISEDAEKLMEKIKERGLDLNVDIF